MNTQWTTGVSVTPNDSQDVGFLALLVGGTGGTLRIQMRDSQAAGPVTLTVAAGIIYPVAVTRVYATGTTAIAVVGFN